MERKELERQNLITLFKYNSPGEIEKAEGKGKQAFEKLYNKYPEEIEKINNEKFLYNSILQHNARIQKLDLCLKISR